VEGSSVCTVLQTVWHIKVQRDTCNPDWQASNSPFQITCGNTSPFLLIEATNCNQIQLL